MFGGQNLQPADNQTQLNDMWILTLPSFTWIEVDQSSQSVPYARAGHSCNIWQGQMVVVGGYIGDEISCDSPGVYVYDLSSLTWVEQFTALSTSNGSASSSSSSSTASESIEGTSSSTAAAQSSGASEGFVSSTETNPYNQQLAQLANETDPGGLEGSYGYEVPKVIISVIGGAQTGGATLTTPRVTATEGPLATGKALVYTVTQSGGATVTETSAPGSGGNATGGSGGGSGSSGHSGPNVAAIVAGVIAGLLFMLVCYLAFCAWLYRKQLVLYKRHVEMAQRRVLGEKPPPAFQGLMASQPGESDKSSSQKYGGASLLVPSEEASSARSGSNGTWPGHVRNNSGTESLVARSSSDNEEMEDLLAGHEPTFLGVMLAPRRSLRVINRD